MIIATEPNDALLLTLALDYHSIGAERTELPDGGALFVLDVADCLALYAEIGLTEAATVAAGSPEAQEEPILAPA